MNALSLKRYLRNSCLWFRKMRVSGTSSEENREQKDEKSIRGPGLQVQLELFNRITSLHVLSVKFEALADKIAAKISNDQKSVGWTQTSSLLYLSHDIKISLRFSFGTVQNLFHNSFHNLFQNSRKLSILSTSRSIWRPITSSHLPSDCQVF